MGPRDSILERAVPFPTVGGTNAAGLWPFVARDNELGQILADTRGAVLVGQAGVGKTRLLGAALDAIAVTAPRVVRIAGTESLSAVPFGAFAGGLAREVEAGAPVDALARAVRALAEDAP